MTAAQKTKLNAAQAAAVQHQDGPLLIIAGPGAGKTFTLVERIVHLIQNGVAPEQILVATFTEKAAAELVTRVSNRALELGVKINLHSMYIGTLHSIFLRLLEEFREFTRLKRNYRLFDQFDQQYFLYRNSQPYLEADSETRLLGRPSTSSWLKVKKLIGYLNQVSEEYLDVEALQESEDERIQAIGHFYQIYQEQLLEENALDFSMIQVEMLRLLENYPKVLGQIREKITYLMVDEYQDTNTIQERILLLLAGDRANICVVGDDDQGLYRFRGATIRNILEFPQNFSAGQCRQITLSTNYRSHPQIIGTYNNWMTGCDWQEDNQQFRFSKTIEPPVKEFPKYQSVVKLGVEGSALNYHEEVLRFIRTLEANGQLTDYNQLAFLFRSVKNKRVVALANYLEEQGIPVFSPRSALFFEREEVRLLVGALVFIFPDLFAVLRWSDDAQLSIWDYYQDCKRFFADTVRADREKHAGLLRWCQIKAKAHLTLTDKTTYGFAALLYQLLEYPLFADLVSADLTGAVHQQRAAYNVALFSKLLFKFEYLHQVSVITARNREKLLQQLFNQYLRFIYSGGIEEYEEFDEYAPSGCVSFLTIHQSKGLEFPVVLVGSMEAIPRKQYAEIDEILQHDFYHKPPFEPLERIKYFDFWRLYYTAFSRAQNLLVLTTQEVREGHGKSPSAYLRPLYDALPDWDEDANNWSELQLTNVKETNIKREYSFTSHILLYENCPLQYKFYKELEFAEVRVGGMIGGTLLHQTIEDIHKAVLREDVHLVTDENIENWFNRNYHLLTKQLRSYLQPGQLRALLSQIIRYKERMRNRWHTIQEAEVEVSLVKEDYILKGTIDLIRGEDGTVELIDFKSGNKPDVNDPTPYTQRALRGFRRQLEIYAHLVEERTGQTVSRMHLYFPKEELGSPYITFHKDEQRIGQTMDTFDSVVRKIEEKDFSINHIQKSEKQCGNCDMRYHCNPSHYS